MIEICNLELSYEGEEKIFSSLSLKIEKNKPVLIISEPGCGKTSLAKALTGTASKFHSAKVSGSFFLDSLDLFSLDVPERKNYVARSIQNPDEAILFPTVEDEIAFPLEQRCLKREEMRKEKLNISAIHVDFMVGSDELSVYGDAGDGAWPESPMSATPWRARSRCGTSSGPTGPWTASRMTSWRPLRKNWKKASDHESERRKRTDPRNQGFPASL